MGKSSKKRKSVARKLQKRARKSAKAALYRSYAEQGRKNQSKRSRRNENQSTAQRGNHAMANCGNVGCKRCYPRLNRVISDSGH